jgi:CRISPR system Cascade subunit CasB
VTATITTRPTSASPNTLATNARGARALAWWRKHCHPVNGDPGTRARLRRARSVVDALQINAAVELARRLGAVPKDHPAPDWKIYAALDLGRVLAHVKEDDARHPMAAAGWQSFPGDRKESDAGTDRPRLSEARFRRLLQARGGEETVSAFVRLVALLDGRVNVAQLTTDFLDWNHPERGDRVRERWAFHYLAAGSAAPTTASTDNEDDAE